MRAASFSLACLALLVCSAGAATAQNADPIEVVRRIAAAGAIDVAMQRIEQGQPNDPSAPSWSDWETLRFDLLARRGRDAELLKRAAAHRSLTLPERTSVAISLLAARSALKLGQAAEARRHLSRVLLSADLGGGEYRQARLTVIESYLAERKGDDAYRSMLRFQQDFSPLRKEEVERFVGALLALERVNDAAGWLTQLDSASPSAAILRLRAGLLTPDAAVAQGRALLAKGAGDAAWTLLLAGGLAQKNRAVEIEVREARLHAIASSDTALAAERAEQLWKLYADSAQQFANQAQLLMGDDAAWAERAGRMLPTQPQLARALLGSLARNARSAEARATAQLQLVTSLRTAKLALAALRLFADARLFPGAALDARLRFELGALAAESRQPADAVRYWQNLPPPAGMSAQEWQLRYLATLFQAGMVDAGLDAAKSLLASKTTLGPELIRRLISVASDVLDGWHAKAAETLYGMLLPLTAGPDRIAVLSGLARSRELTGEFRAAADAYLHLAALASAPETDREALRAREAGAINLAKAGMLDDARATFQWLSKNAKDPTIRDSATRALKNL